MANSRLVKPQTSCVSAQAVYRIRPCRPLGAGLTRTGLEFAHWGERFPFLLPLGRTGDLNGRPFLLKPHRKLALNISTEVEPGNFNGKPKLSCPNFKGPRLKG